MVVPLQVIQPELPVVQVVVVVQLDRLQRWLVVVEAKAVPVATARSRQRPTVVRPVAAVAQDLQRAPTVCRVLQRPQR